MNFHDQPQENKVLAEKVIAQFAQLESQRGTWEHHWQECYDYILPRKNEVTTKRTPGEKRNTELYDTTAIMSNTLLAGALHGMLTSPTTRFFDLTTGDDALDKNEEVRLWMQDTADRMYGVMNTSNFQTEVHENYLDLCCIGTATLFILDSDTDVVHFSARPIKEIYVKENNLGYIDTVFRKFEWDARQLVQEFGIDNLPEEIVKAYRAGECSKMECIHLIAPKADWDEEAPMPYISLYVLRGQTYLLSKKGYREQPYAVSRWEKTTGESYGRGPGMEMLPDVKMVNEMMKTTIRGAQKTVDPPMMVSDDGVIGKVRLTPGGLTTVRPTSDVPIRPLIVDARIDFGYQAVEDVRRRIRAGFYVDQLQLNEGPQMTATEVMQRTEEKLRLMGPVLGRQHNEFLRPIINRVFAIMYRANLFRPVPDVLRGRNVDVKYSSLVARAQRMNEGQNLTRALSVAAPIINAKPESLDNLNADEALKYVLSIYGVPQTILRTNREVEEAREARAEAQSRAVAEEEANNAAQRQGQQMPAMAQMMQAMKQ